MRLSERTWHGLLLGLGGGYLALAVWAFAHPASFTVVLAGFGPANDHLVGDFAACSATFGTGLVLGARVPEWRTFALVMAALWNGMHAVVHLRDIGIAHPPIVGPIEAAALVAMTLLFAWLARASRFRQVIGLVSGDRPGDAGADGEYHQ